LPFSSYLAIDIAFIRHISISRLRQYCRQLHYWLSFSAISADFHWYIFHYEIDIEYISFDDANISILISFSLFVSIFISLSIDASWCLSPTFSPFSLFHYFHWGFHWHYY
jgi:hypothetical protein